MNVCFAWGKDSVSLGAARIVQQERRILHKNPNRAYISYGSKVFYTERKFTQKILSGYFMTEIFPIEFNFSANCLLCIYINTLLNFN